MEKGSKIISVYINNSDDLGLKIVFATNKVTRSYYAVIIEVNPCSTCYKENISVGDVLLSFDGINIDSYETLENLSIYKSANNKKNQLLQLKIKKGEAFEISGLYRACLNSPCSEICKTMEEWRPKITPRRSIDNKIDLQSKTLGSQFIPVVSSQSIKNNTLSSLEDSKKPYVDKIKITYQKALPMKNRNESASSKTKLRPKKSFKSHIISPAQPTFINRKPNQNNDRVTTNLKESKSMTNLSNLTVDHSKEDSSSSSSWDSSDHSSDELTNKFVPKIKSQMDNNSSENSTVFIPNNTNELENSKRLSRSMDLIISEFKKLQATKM